MDKFSILYKKRSFVYHYENEGLEEGVFAEALENVHNLIQDYEDIDKQT